MVNRPVLITLGLALLLALPAAAAQNPADRERKQARAVRVADGAIRVDGRLDEDAWRTAAPLTEFVQKEPDQGAPPTDRMDVRFVYDDAALYVGARMYSTAQPIGHPVARGAQAVGLVGPVARTRRATRSQKASSPALA